MSFFKRAVVGALERREEVRDANQLKYETDVTAGITKLNEAEKEMKKNNLIVRNRKKLITPIGINVFNETGYKFSEPVLLNVLMSSKGDADLATDTLVRMAKNRTPDTTATVTDGMEGFTQESASTRDLSDMSGDTTRALQDASSMISTTSTQLPSQQKALITIKENERTQRYGGGFAGNILNTLLGGVSGPSVREAVKERYSSMFRTPEEGEQAYTDAMNYMEEVRDKGEASTVPDLPPNMLADIQREVRKAKKYETFEKEINGVIDGRLRELKMFIVNKAPSGREAMMQKLLNTESGGFSKGDMNKLPPAVQNQIKTYLEIRKEAIQGSTSIFNNTSINTAFGSASQFLDTVVDGKDQMARYLDRMKKASGETLTSKSSANKTSKQTSNKPTRKRSNTTIDLSGSTVLSSEELYSTYNVDDANDFGKKYKSKFIGKRLTENGYVNIYNMDGTQIAIGDGGKIIRQLP